MLEDVPNPQFTPRMRANNEMVPRCFVPVSGTVDAQKLSLANNMLVDWQLHHSKRRVRDGECPWYSPNLQNMKVRTFLARMNKNYAWQYTKKDFDRLEGCLNSVMAKVDEERFKEWVSTHQH